jgi:hypothetical protein
MNQGDLMSNSLGIINLKNYVYPKGLVPLENMFSTHDSHKASIQGNAYSKHKVGETLPVNTISEDDPKFVYMEAKYIDG